MDVSTAQYLWRRGFSPEIIERFFRPFFGGVFLDEKLATSAGLFRYYLKKFATGRALLPARGIGQIPRQLADRLPPGKLRLGCKVARLARLGDGIDGVVTEQGETVACEHLLLATDAPATARLLERPAAVPPALGTTVVYLSTNDAPVRTRHAHPARRTPAVGAAFRRADQRRAGIRAAGPTPAQRDRARPARMDDAALSAAVAREIAEVYPAASGRLNPVAVIDVPYAQHRQPAGFRPGPRPAPAPTHLDNVWLAGDQTGACSIQSSMVSGERAAAFLAGRVRR